jgi:hypothetical protein
MNNTPDTTKVIMSTISVILIILVATLLLTASL